MRRAGFCVVCCQPYAQNVFSYAVAPCHFFHAAETRFPWPASFRFLDMARDLPAFHLRRHSPHGAGRRNARLVRSSHCQTARRSFRIRAPLESDASRRLADCTKSGLPADGVGYRARPLGIGYKSAMAARPNVLHRADGGRARGGVPASASVQRDSLARDCDAR